MSSHVEKYKLLNFSSLTPDRNITADRPPTVRLPAVNQLLSLRVAMLQNDVEGFHVCRSIVSSELFFAGI